MSSLPIVVNGKKVCSLSVTDRATQYGDGVFTTALISSNAIQFFNEHLSRLKDGCERLYIQYPGDDIIERDIALLIADLPISQMIIKIIISRGNGGRGYQPDLSSQATCICSLHHSPDYPAAYKTEGVRVTLCEMKMGRNSRLAGIKHLNRLEQVLARSEWQNEYEEGLVFDSEQLLVEGTKSNVFLWVNNEWVTPDLSFAGVAGIMRDYILALANKTGVRVVQRDVTMQDINNTESAFLCNSVIGVWPIKQLKQQALRIHPWVHTLNKTLEISV